MSCSDVLFMVDVCDVRLHGSVTVLDTVTNIHTVIVYLPDPNHTTKHSTYVRNLLCTNMESAVISYTYRGFYPSTGMFDFFHPDRNSCSDTLLILQKAYEMIDSLSANISTSHRLVLVADSLSILLAEQLLKTSYTFSHIVYLNQLPNSVEDMFTNTNTIQHKKLRKTFRCISHASILPEVAHAFRQLRTPYQSILFPVVRGRYKNTNLELLSYKEALYEWNTCMVQTYPHLFEDFGLHCSVSCHYYVQCSPDQPCHDHIINSMSSPRSIQFYTTDKWVYYPCTDIEMCISRLSDWYMSTNKHTLSKSHIVDMNSMTSSQQTIDRLYSQNSQRRVRLQQVSDKKQKHRTCSKSTTIISTTTIPHEWFYLLPSMVKKWYIDKLVHVYHNYRPWLLLTHTFDKPTLLYGFPSCTINIRSKKVQHVKISIMLYHTISGMYHTMLEEYEQTVDQSDSVQTIRMKLPFIYQTIEKDMIIIIGLTQYKTLVQTVKHWIYTNDPSSHIHVSNIWIDFPMCYA